MPHQNVIATYYKIPYHNPFFVTDFSLSGGHSSARLRSAAPEWWLSSSGSSPSSLPPPGSSSSTWLWSSTIAPTSVSASTSGPTPSAKSSTLSSETLSSATSYRCFSSQCAISSSGSKFGDETFPRTLKMLPWKVCSRNLKLKWWKCLWQLWFSLYCPGSHSTSSLQESNLVDQSRNGKRRSSQSWPL